MVIYLKKYFPTQKCREKEQLKVEHVQLGLVEILYIFCSVFNLYMQWCFSLYFINLQGFECRSWKGDKILM